MATQTLFPCTRCNGTGRLACFSNVLGGVCFKCGGKGTQASKPAAPAIRWEVSGIDRTTGERAPLYFMKARTPAEAIKKARATYPRASDAFRAQFDMTNPTAAQI